MASDVKLTSAQQVAVEHIEGHLQIIACAGSGKTEVISRRIANILQKKNDVKPENIVAFTFTEKAAENLKKRIENVLGYCVPDMYIGTIHGFCKHLLSEHSEKFADFKILDTVKNHLFITRYSDKCGMSTLKLYPSIQNNNLFQQCIDKFIDDYDSNFAWEEKHRVAFNEYKECLYSHKYIDFSLLIFEALNQIKENKIVQDYLKQVKYLVVDEYQDVNDLQEDLIGAIANYGANVCVVGDDDQTIYQFRGSNADNMISFPERYPNVYQVRLEHNFRCQKEIVDVAEKVIIHNKKRLDKRMIAGGIPSVATAEAKGYADMDSEFIAIADEIERLNTRGTKYKDIAILVRKGKYVPMIANVLATRGIPYTADSAESFFEGNYFNRFVETLRILDNIDKAALYEQWSGIIDDSQLSIGFKYLRSCTRGGNYRLSEIVRGFCDKVGLLNENAYDITTRTEDLEGICKILDDYDEIYGDYQLSARINGILRFLGLNAPQEYKYHNFREIMPDENAVKVMTVHKSKGLEFNTVFLPLLNKSEFPVSNKGGKQYYHVLGGVFEANKEKYQSDIEDERKLFYVAVTRAEKNLYLSYNFDKKPVSEFVSNAAESTCLKIDRADLESHTKKQYDWSLVDQARSALYDYYGTGNMFCKGIILEYKDVCRQGSDAILARAQELGLV